MVAHSHADPHAQWFRSFGCTARHGVATRYEEQLGFVRLHWQAWQVLRKQHHRLDMLFQQALPPDARTRTRRHNPHYVHCFGALQRCQPPPLRDVRPHLARRFAACTSCVLQRSMVQRSMVWTVACVGLQLCRLHTRHVDQRMRTLLRRWTGTARRTRRFVKVSSPRRD
jgi:hypothetical protein